MSIPKKCEVLVIGGGPAGSYAASALAREGVDTVVLEGDKFPRYHVGESMLPSIRHFLRFIDLDSTFDNYGFRIKKGAAFKLNKSRPAAYTDFVAATGPNGYTWNVRRSDADNLIFRHAEKSGAKVFDTVKVHQLNFLSHGSQPDGNGSDTTNPGRAVSAEWSREDGSSGQIKFDYVIDASGRKGLMSCKYLKNRRYNQGLKNVANWGYWKGAGTYAVGSREEGCPYFEHLEDGSGWVWFIQLHDGTTSVGVVMNQHVANSKKKTMAPTSTRDFYLQTLNNEVSGIKDLLSGAELAEQYIHSASDWSYSASSYASPNVRIAGDAGCFIDPFFSSGVHLALLTGLSAATTIAASRRSDCSEQEAGSWHTGKVQDGYARFLVVVQTVLKQIRQGEDIVLGDFDEGGFDRAFAHFRPIIQGTADVSSSLTQDEISKTIDFCISAYFPTEPRKKEAVLKKLDDLNAHAPSSNEARSGAKKEPESVLTPEEMRILSTIRAREMVRQEDILSIETFNTDTINDLTANLERGSLGLVRPAAKTEVEKHKRDVLGLMVGEAALFEKHTPVAATEVSVQNVKM